MDQSKQFQQLKKMIATKNGQLKVSAAVFSAAAHAHVHAHAHAHAHAHTRTILANQDGLWGHLSSGCISFFQEVSAAHTLLAAGFAGAVGQIRV